MYPVLAVCFVFIGCCSNVYFLELLVSEYPGSGNIVTFSQFLFIALEGFVFTSKFGTKKAVVPFSYYVSMVSMFFIVQVINNLAFNFNISMPLHMIFRSGSLAATLLLGIIILKRKYNLSKYISVGLISSGIIFCTIASAKQVHFVNGQPDPLAALHYDNHITQPRPPPKPRSNYIEKTAVIESKVLRVSIKSNNDIEYENCELNALNNKMVQTENAVDAVIGYISKISDDTANREIPTDEENLCCNMAPEFCMSLWPETLPSHTGNATYDYLMWLIGISLLVSALFMSSRMGIFQEQTYTKYGKHPAEAMFYNHALPLPAFLLMYKSIYSAAIYYNASAPLLIPIIGLTVPKLWMYLCLNVLTQYVCIRSVFILTTECTSLAVTLVVTLRKFISLMFSIYYFQNPFTIYHWIGAAFVFLGTLIFTEVIKVDSIITKEKKTT